MSNGCSPDIFISEKSHYINAFVQDLLFTQSQPANTYVERNLQSPVFSFTVQLMPSSKLLQKITRFSSWRSLTRI